MDQAAIARMRMRAQRLWTARFEDAAEALRWLTAVQAQDFPYSRWSLGQRTKRPDASAVDRAFDEGRILRTHILRPTWHFVAPQDLRWLVTLSGPRVNALNARRYAELGLDSKTFARTNAVIARAVADRTQTRRELAAELVRRRISTDGQRLAYILMRAELDAVICSGSIRGKQHTYAAFDERVPTGPIRPRDEALGELALRFFSARGPATLRDFSWWSGFAISDARRALEIAREGLRERVVAGRTYWFAAGSAVAAPRATRIDLVQCYDESIISYTESRDVLQNPPDGFPVPRNIGGFAHVVLCDGRLLGHWRPRPKRKGIEVETRFARALTDGERRAAAEAVKRYLRFVGASRL